MYLSYMYETRGVNMYVDMLRFDSESTCTNSESKCCASIGRVVGSIPADRRLGWFGIDWLGDFGRLSPAVQLGTCSSPGAR